MFFSFLTFLCFYLIVRAMFVIHASYCSLLPAVCRGLSDVSVGYLTEVMDGSSVIYGVEVEISGQFHIASNTIRTSMHLIALCCLLFVVDLVMLVLAT
jgi:hypothetical protein